MLTIVKKAPCVGADRPRCEDMQHFHIKTTQIKHPICKTPPFFLTPGVGATELLKSLLSLLLCTIFTLVWCIGKSERLERSTHCKVTLDLHSFCSYICLYMNRNGAIFSYEMKCTAISHWCSLSHLQQQQLCCTSGSASSSAVDAE